METTQPSQRPSRPIVRGLLLIVGGITVIVGVLADRIFPIAMERGGGGQIMLIAIGTLILLVSIFNSPRMSAYLGAAYRGTALILLNMLVFIAVLELLVILSANISLLRPDRDLPPERRDLPYYQQQKWGATYWREHDAVNQSQYVPYVMWRRIAYHGETININEDGIRETPGATCDQPDAYRVYIFGGSTIWGVGAPDSGTIPAYLLQLLDEQMDRPLCVVNYGEWGYVIIQESLALTLELQKGNVPDLVIFYDGLNDVFAAYQTGTARQQNQQEIGGILESNRIHPIIVWLRGSYAFEAFSKLLPRPSGTNATGTITQRLTTDELANEVVENYWNTYQLIDTLSREYGFDYVMFWQPSLAVGKKPLLPQEEVYKALMDAGHRDLSVATYRLMEQTEADYPNFVNIADTLDNVDTLLWIDALHIIPEGNELIAHRIMQTIASRPEK